MQADSITSAPQDPICQSRDRPRSLSLGIVTRPPHCHRVSHELSVRRAYHRGRAPSGWPELTCTLATRTVEMSHATRLHPLHRPTRWQWAHVMMLWSSPRLTPAPTGHGNSVIACVPASAVGSIWCPIESETFRLMVWMLDARESAARAVHHAALCPSPAVLPDSHCNIRDAYKLALVRNFSAHLRLSITQF